MTVYKMRMLSFLNHLPIIILEGGLIYATTFIAFYQWIWIMITSLILFATVVATSIHSSKTYTVSEDALLVSVGNGKTKQYSYTQICTIKERKRHMEIGFRETEKEKVKTIYLGWYIKKYKDMKQQIMEYISKSDHYDRIIFID